MIINDFINSQEYNQRWKKNLQTNYLDYSYQESVKFYRDLLYSTGNSTQSIVYDNLYEKRTDKEWIVYTYN